MSQTHLLSRLLAASVSISRKAASIIREVKVSGALDVREKSLNDFVTKADFQSQMCIIKSLEKMFPLLKFCGEEGDLKSEEFQNIETKVDKRVLELVEKSKSLLSDYETLKEDELTVWVDPLDGTREFTMGAEYASEVTVLIGFSWKGNPIAGVINQPFYSKDLRDMNGDRVIWGIKSLGAYHNTDSKEEYIKIQTNVQQRESQSEQRTVVTTRSHMTDTLTQFFESIPNGVITHRGGSGFKTLQVIFSEVECYLYPRGGTKRWDTCAGEAIVRSLGGQFTDVFNRPYDYSLVNNDVENSRGIIVTLENHEFYLKHLSQDLLNEVQSNSGKKF